MRFYKHLMPPHILTRRGRTPLAWAAMTGNDQLVLGLVARGSSLTAVDRDGLVPRQLAQRYQKMGTVDLLACMARQQLLVEDSRIEQERDEEGRDQDRVMVPQCFDE